MPHKNSHKAGNLKTQNVRLKEKSVCDAFWLIFLFYFMAQKTMVINCTNCTNIMTTYIKFQTYKGYGDPKILWRIGLAGITPLFRSPQRLWRIWFLPPAEKRTVAQMIENYLSLIKLKSQRSWMLFLLERFSKTIQVKFEILPVGLQDHPSSEKNGKYRVRVRSSCHA